MKLKTTTGIAGMDPLEDSGAHIKTECQTIETASIPYSASTRGKIHLHRPTPPSDSSEPEARGGRDEEHRGHGSRDIEPVRASARRLKRRTEETRHAEDASYGVRRDERHLSARLTDDGQITPSSVSPARSVERSHGHVKGQKTSKINSGHGTTRQKTPVVSFSAPAPTPSFLMTGVRKTSKKHAANGVLDSDQAPRKRSNAGETLKDRNGNASSTTEENETKANLGTPITPLGPSRSMMISATVSNLGPNASSAGSMFGLDSPPTPKDKMLALPSLDSEMTSITGYRDEINRLVESIHRDVNSKGKKSGVFKCEVCDKVYRHPSCLVKHRWEHTKYWQESSKLLLSKHQQVQLLEAAAILVDMENKPKKNHESEPVEQAEQAERAEQKPLHSEEEANSDGDDEDEDEDEDDLEETDSNDMDDEQDNAGDVADGHHNGKSSADVDGTNIVRGVSFVSGFQPRSTELQSADGSLPAHRQSWYLSPHSRGLAPSSTLAHLSRSTDFYSTPSAWPFGTSPSSLPKISDTRSSAHFRDDPNPSGKESDGVTATGAARSPFPEPQTPLTPAMTLGSSVGGVDVMMDDVLVLNEDDESTESDEEFRSKGMTGSGRPGSSRHYPARATQKSSGSEPNDDDDDDDDGTAELDVFGHDMTSCK